MSAGTVPQPKTNTTADSKQDMQNFIAGGPATATGSTKVTLVKPVPTTETAKQETMAENNASEKLSYARPKVGRASAGSVTPDTKVTLPPLKEEPGKIDFSSVPSDVADMPPTRPWDFKFALLLVTLFVAVNLGLIMLLHTSHHAAKHIGSETAAIKNETAAASKVAVSETPVPEPVVTRHEVTTLAVPPAVPALPAAPVMQQEATAPVQTPPAVVSAPVSASVAPAAPAAPVADVPVSAVPVAVTAPAETAVPVTTPSATPATSQDLLSIIGKN